MLSRLRARRLRRSRVHAATARGDHRHRGAPAGTGAAQRREHRAADIRGRSRTVGSTHHSEILNRVPGTLIQRGSGQESLTAIRSPVLTGPGSCGAFLMLENGVPIRPVGFCNVNEMFEVNTEQADAIEVLRGPVELALRLQCRARHGQRRCRRAPAERAGAARAASTQVRTTTDASKLAAPRARRPHDRRAWRRSTRTTAGGATSSGFDEGKLNATLATAIRDRAAAGRSRRHDPRPADGWLHHGRGCLPRRGIEPQQPEPGRVSQGARAAAHGPAHAGSRRCRCGSSCGRICAARGWSSCSTSCSASRSRRTDRKASAS